MEEGRGFEVLGVLAPAMFLYNLKKLVMMPARERAVEVIKNSFKYKYTVIKGL